MRKAYRAVVLSVAAAAIPAVAHAQMGVKDWHFGPQVNLQLNENSGFGIGARAQYNLAKMIPSVPQLKAFASFDYFLKKNYITEWELNIDGIYMFPMTNSPIHPYAGAGINYLNVSVDVPGFGSASSGNAGLGFLGGIQFKPMGSGITPFVEARIATSSGSAFTLAGGILF